MLTVLHVVQRASNEIDCRNETLPLRVTPPFRDNAAAERRVLRLGALAGAQCGGLWAATPPGATCHSRAALGKPRRKRCKPKPRY